MSVKGDMHLSAAAWQSATQIVELAVAPCLGLLWDSPVCASMLSCEAEDSRRSTCHWVVHFRTRNTSDAALQGARSSLRSSANMASETMTS